MFDVYPDIRVIRLSKCYKSLFTRGATNSDALMAPVAGLSEDIAPSRCFSGSSYSFMCDCVFAFAPNDRI